MKTTASQPLPMFDSRSAPRPGAVPFTPKPARSRRERLHAFLRDAFWVLGAFAVSGCAFLPLAAFVGDAEGFGIYFAIVMAGGVAAVLAGIATHFTGRKAQ
jgi:hypothetical protein